MENIVVALITALGLMGVQVIISKRQERTQDMKLQHSLEMYEQKTDMVIETIKADIKRLEDKQDLHNSVIERMTIVENTIVDRLGNH